MFWDSKNREQDYPKNLICLGVGDIPLKSRNDVLLWCVDSCGELCVLVTPRVAWEKVDSETSMYCERYSLAMLMVCLGVNTECPALMPAAVPLERAMQFEELAATVGKYYALPRDVRNIIPSVFTAIQLIEPENNAQLELY